MPIGSLGDLISLGSAEFRLRMLMYVVGFDAKSAVPLNLIITLVTLTFALLARGADFRALLPDSLGPAIVARPFSSEVDRDVLRPRHTVPALPRLRILPTDLSVLLIGLRALQGVIRCLTHQAAIKGGRRASYAATPITVWTVQTTLTRCGQNLYDLGSEAEYEEYSCQP